MTKEQRKRLAAIRAIAPLAVPPGDRQPVDKIEEAAAGFCLSPVAIAVENPPENLPQVAGRI